MTFLKEIGTLSELVSTTSDDKTEISEQSAIAAALNGDWAKAVTANTHLLKNDKNNISILNRLGFAYTKTGEIAKALRIYNRVLKLDPYNPIALRNSKKLGIIRKKDAISNTQGFSPLDFLEDPGKTKIASCINLAPNQILSALYPGQEVALKPKNHTVELRTDTNEYIAALPDDISFKLIKLMTNGNRYQVIVKGASKNQLLVIIREVFRGKRFANQPSFLNIGASYIPFSKSDSKDPDKPDVTPTGEQEDLDSPPNEPI